MGARFRVIAVLVSFAVLVAVVAALRPSPASAAVTMPGGFVSVSPARVLDTRTGLGAPATAVAPGVTIALQVTGRGGVPVTGISAVALNLTATAPTAAGHSTVYADGTTRPTASALNFVAGQTTANLVISPVGTNGRVAVYNGSTGTVHLVADITGYHLSGTLSAGGAFGPVSPARVLDTRTGLGAPATTVAPRATVALQVTGRGGVPASGVSAVTLNLTAVAPTAAGYATVHADGTTRPNTSSLNYSRGRTTANLVIAPVGATGKVAVYNGSDGTVHLVADVTGYHLSGVASAGGAFGPVSPARVLDTRTGLGAPATAVAPRATVALQVTGRGGVPVTGISSVALNLTATAPTAAGYATVHASGATRPNTSSLNYSRGRTTANLVIAPVGATGKVAVYNGSDGTVHLVADVTGYHLSGVATSPGTFVGKGFDACTAPPSDLMAAWITASPYRVVGIYIGGNNRACAQPELTASWVSTQRAAGWRLLPIYLGDQPYCTTSSKQNRFTAANAAASGRAAADDAVVQANALGLAAGSTIFNDIEAYSTTDPTCTTAVLTFQSAWTTRLHERGFVSGFYSSLGSGIRDQVAAYTSPVYERPDYIWFARYDGVVTVADPSIPSTYWVNRRIKQYQSPVQTGGPETYGGFTLPVDRNQIDVAALN